MKLGNWSQRYKIYAPTVGFTEFWSSLRAVARLPPSYRANSNRKIAKLVQRLARAENARRSGGSGKNGIVWTHVKGHAGHPGNEWADFLADIGRLAVFTEFDSVEYTEYQRAYPYAVDEYEETDAAMLRHQTAPMLAKAIADRATPAGEKLRVPRDWVIFGDYAKWRKRTGSTSTTTRVLDMH